MCEYVNNCNTTSCLSQSHQTHHAPAAAGASTTPPDLLAHHRSNSYCQLSTQPLCNCTGNGFQGQNMLYCTHWLGPVEPSLLMGCNWVPTHLCCEHPPHDPRPVIYTHTRGPGAIDSGRQGKNRFEEVLASSAAMHASGRCELRPASAYIGGPVWHGVDPCIAGVAC